MAGPRRRRPPQTAQERSIDLEAMDTASAPGRAAEAARTASGELRRRQAARHLARRRLLTRDEGGRYGGFVVQFPPSPNYRVGPHIWAIAQELQKATETVEAGGRYYVCVSCPFRHGKTALIGKRYPAWHLGRNPDHEVILTSYADNLAQAASRECRRTVLSDEYWETFGIEVSQESWSVQTWEIRGHHGKLNASGMTGAVVGKGAHVLIIDDPHKGWIETRNRLVRDTVWNTFLNDCMTRLAPAHAVVILATPLNVDDLLGRLRLAMAEDPKFPQFRFLSFPARSDQYEGGYLFLERYPVEWYEAQFAMLRGARAAAMLQMQPVKEGGQRFKVEALLVRPAAPPGLKWCRYWDLASSAKERESDDPSYTAGAKVAVDTVRDNGVLLPRLWVADMVRLQGEAPERDELIVRTARLDGPEVEIVLETVGGYKDTATRIERRLRGLRTVTSDAKAVDKVTRADALEPVVQAGHCVLVAGPWVQDFQEELREFPDGTHDDQVDAVSGAFAHLWEEPDEYWVA